MGPGTDAVYCPLGIAPMRARDVLGRGRRRAGAPRRALQKLDRDAGVELLANQPVRHRVVMPIDVDVVVDPDQTDPRFPVVTGLGG